MATKSDPVMQWYFNPMVRDVRDSIPGEDAEHRRRHERWIIGAIGCLAYAFDGDTLTIARCRPCR